jgi:hypothetical protein
MESCSDPDTLPIIAGQVGVMCGFKSRHSPKLPRAYFGKCGAISCSYGHTVVTRRRLSAADTDQRG